MGRQRTATEEEALGIMFERMEALRDHIEFCSAKQRLVPPGWSSAHRRAPCSAPKCKLTIRLNAEMVDWYRKLGHGWQTRMNDVLECYMHSVISKLAPQPGEQRLNGELL